MGEYPVEPPATSDAVSLYVIGVYVNRSGVPAVKWWRNVEQPRRASSGIVHEFEDPH
jgi:hypothetical protein